MIYMSAVEHYSEWRQLYVHAQPCMQVGAGRVIRSGRGHLLALCCLTLLSCQVLSMFTFKWIW
jgi:hypothetical protein